MPAFSRPDYDDDAGTCGEDGDHDDRGGDAIAVGEDSRDCYPGSLRCGYLYGTHAAEHIRVLDAALAITRTQSETERQLWWAALDAAERQRLR